MMSARGHAIVWGGLYLIVALGLKALQWVMLAGDAARSPLTAAAASRAEWATSPLMFRLDLALIVVAAMLVVAVVGTLRLRSAQATAC